MNTTKITVVILSAALLLSAAAGSRFPEDALFNQQFAFMCASTPRRVRWVFENHLKQLNRCSVRGLERERTPDTQLFFGPDVIKGKADVDEVFANFCKSRRNGGLRGIKFVEKQAFIVGNVISVKWVADAPFLAEPYPGSDAYVTCGGKMLTIVSSFDASELKFKE